MSSRVLLVISFILSSPAFAQEPTVTALNFQSWKDQQILEAQNQVLRSASHISQLRAHGSNGDLKETSLPASGRLKRVAESEAVLAERDLKRAQENLDSAKNLQFEDYVNVYIPTLSDEPDALAKLTEKLSKDELSIVVKSLVKRGAKPSDAKRNNGALLEGLTVSSRSNGL